MTSYTGKYRIDQYGTIVTVNFTCETKETEHKQGTHITKATTKSSEEFKGYIEVPKIDHLQLTKTDLYYSSLKQDLDKCEIALPLNEFAAVHDENLP